MKVEFTAEILQNGDMEAAYVIVPYDIKKLYGKGRLLVNASFDGVAYQDQVVKMGSPSYIIGVTKAIRKKINKSFGDQVFVTLEERKGKKQMWTCPTCGREFKRKNQSHYCGEKPSTIEAYISKQDEDQKADLNRVYKRLKTVLPDAKEKISWAMPTFWQGENIIHFAGAKNHLGIYPGPAAIEAFKEELKDFKTTKGAIQMPYGKIDLDLIEKIAKWNLDQAEKNKK